MNSYISSPAALKVILSSEIKSRERLSRRFDGAKKSKQRELNPSTRPRRTSEQQKGSLTSPRRFR